MRGSRRVRDGHVSTEAEARGIWILALKVKEGAIS